MKLSLLVALPLLFVSSPVQAKPALKWINSAPPGLPKGATFAVLSGDPGKAGKFTIRIKMPTRYAVPPHWHPTDEKVTLVSGKLSYGMGKQFDRPGAKGLGVGKSIVMKAKMNHWVFTGDGAVVEVSAMGPFKITYANPKDDPRKK